jgi:hypothetical protein
MRTMEKMDSGFKNNLQFRNNYTSLENNYRIQQFRNQKFIVPWQVVETEKKEFRVE